MTSYKTNDRSLQASLRCIKNGHSFYIRMTAMAFRSRTGGAFVFVLGSSLWLVACSPEKIPVERARPVRSITVEKTEQSETLSLTGQIRAQQEVNLAFRLSGRIIERRFGVGDRLAPGDIVARLDSSIQRDAVTAAEATVATANGVLAQVTASYQRQKELLAKGFTTRAQFDQTQQQLTTAEEQVSSAHAQLSSAQEQLGYTNLISTGAGTVTATGAESGEVVSAGQMVMQVAQSQGSDAVFDIPATLLRIAPRDVAVTIALTDDPTVTAKGRVREVAPQADPTTRMYRVKVELIDPPAIMRLGATVVGSITLTSVPAIAVPATSLTQSSDKPAVWTVDQPDLTVSLRQIEILRYDPEVVIVASGLEPGEVVVTAGVQALRPGQKVRLLGDAQ